MKTPITDDQTRHVFQWHNERGKYVPAGAMVDANLARRLETDRAALMEALALCRKTLGELHASFSTHEEWQALWPAIAAAKTAITTARANFPTP